MTIRCWTDRRQATMPYSTPASIEPPAKMP